jgi:hypothetical protein
MTLGHEKLDVYRLSIVYVAWVEEDIASDRIPSLTDIWNSIPIAIAISISMESKPNKRM